jgi:hypothetical protein
MVMIWNSSTSWTKALRLQIAFRNKAELSKPFLTKLAQFIQRCSGYLINVTFVGGKFLKDQDILYLINEGVLKIQDLALIRVTIGGTDKDKPTIQKLGDLAKKNKAIERIDFHISQPNAEKLEAWAPPRNKLQFLNLSLRKNVEWDKSKMS